MSRGKKTGGRDFQKGNKVGAKGRPPLPSDVKEMRKLTQEEFIRLTNKYLGLTEKQLRQRYSDKTTKALDRIIIAIIQRAGWDGDQVRMNFLLERLVGKVKDNVEFTLNAYSSIAKAYTPEVEDKQGEVIEAQYSKQGDRTKPETS